MTGAQVTGPGSLGTVSAVSRADATAPTGGPALLVRGLSVGFGSVAGRNPLIDDVSFEVAPGECLAIVGESGSGKSLTARSLLGLAGAGSWLRAEELSLGGASVLGLGEAAWRRRRGRDVGLVLQDALVSLDPLRPIGREIGDSLRLHTNLSAAGRARRVLELLAEVGLPDGELRVGQRSGQLSGGQRQRALIASAIALRPPLLIADEPTTALDVTVQARILDLSEELLRAGTALVLISHDLAVVSRIADRVAVMSGGRIVETGATRALLTNPQHRETKRMIAAVPAGRPRGTRLSAQARPQRPAPVVVPAVVPAGVSPVVLEASGLVKSFRMPDRSRLLAVNDVSFTLDRGTTLGIVGESGSGKTTLARLLLALESPDAGDVRVHGEAWSRVPERARRPRRAAVGAVYQDALASFDPRLTVGAVLRDAAGSADQSLELLARVGLSATVLGRRPLELSGGQRQRVGIARALANRPQILICDEPVSALDMTVQAQVLDLLDELQRDLGLSLVFISHDLGVVQHVSDRIVVIENGAVVESGPTEQVFAAPAHPYTRRLLYAVPRLPAP
ncbi:MULTISPECIES: ABC transporter ATP-binding protein [unclassified Cryobacterium]|uniref:ABC transporter ATP-binding protein n=1 Tax=unclassified Cryobacterium TaxID=2649013 RepID=UPI002AB4DDF9|nr:MULTISPECIES: ABC transporter ATP-binding protein [unclassified Cryobacterium]MDY7544149.1 ABC transporter ATP-binding protein [Cryobacterium sp. 5B3]MEB0000443.1 ABC transporter ATP-binding protein [Cryobacterium sp. RTS3]MEB0266933.1 ABC transporter ATP-binding protein [Cryobacterium sp. 10I5]MEB0276163.1 ABC transporter ATP-binding protein [Cryobacterium sp. 5B3]